MPVKYIEVYPTCEVHLLINHPTPMRLVVRERGNMSNNLSAPPNPATPNQKTEVLDFNESLVDISQQATFIEFSPKNSVGKTTGRIHHTDTSDPDPDNHFVSEVLVRIRVHNDVNDFWIGNNQVTLYKNESNFVLSVYAKFDDDTFGDISSHRYLEYSTPDIAFIEVDNNNDKGRVTGKKLTTSGAKRIKITLGGLPPKYVNNVNVIQPLNTPKRKLVCVHGSADVNMRYNILIISEGFTQSQKPAFDFAVKLIADRLMNSRSNSPFNLLKDMFNIWKAFDPSPEDGITAGYPVHKSRGTPIEPSTSTDPATSLDYGLLQARDSKFGVIYGIRYGDRVSEQIKLTSPPVKENWFVPWIPFTTPSFDRRRMRKDWCIRQFLDKYIASLEVDPKHHTGPQFSNVSNVWLRAPDRNFVCLLINDDFAGAARGGTVYGMRLAVKNDHEFNNLTLVGNVFDHSPRIIEPLSFPGLGLAPILAGSNIDATIAKFAHELAHSFGLGDEYESIFRGHKKVLDQNDAKAKRRIEQFANLTHYWQVKEPTSNKIDVSRVLWNKWMRIEQSSILVTPVTPAANMPGNKIEVNIGPYNAVFWLIPPNFINRNAYLRTRFINFDFDPDNSYISDDPLQIKDIDLNTGKITLSGTITKAFPEGSIIYVAKERSGNPLPLIDPIVAQFITYNNKGIPFAAKKPNCENANRDPVNAPVIPGISVANRQFVVGVYEGGGTFNCNVYRPCGNCRMSESRGAYYAPFCPVCKYHIVNLINPNELWRLEDEYPR